MGGEKKRLRTVQQHGALFGEKAAASAVAWGKEGTGKEATE